MRYMQWLLHKSNGYYQDDFAKSSNLDGPKRGTSGPVYFVFGAGSANAIQLFEIAGGVVPPGGI